MVPAVLARVAGVLWPRTFVCLVGRLFARDFNVAARERLHAKLEKVLAEQMPNVVARVSPLELGPPVGWPVQYRVSGPDLAQVRAIALQTRSTHGRGRECPADQFRLDRAVP